MDETAMLEQLLALAGEAGITVRMAGRTPAAEGAAPVESGICRVRGAVWVVLSDSEPAGAQIDVLARALETHAAALLEGRHLPPAVRARIERAGADRSGGG